MKRMRIWTLGAILGLAVSITTPAALVMQVATPKTVGNKAIVQLELKNTFTNNIESVRAVMFLLDDQGKMVGQSAHWIIGGTKDKPGVAPAGKTAYDFVVTTDKPFTKTKVMVNRIILEHGESANPLKDAQIVQTQ
jgi:hypothetical protein